MKKSGILRPELLEAIGSLGHLDEFLVCDAGYPIPDEVLRIDLGYRPGMPPFLDVLEAIAAEIVIEGAVVAAEASDEMTASIARIVGEVQQLSHAKLKERAFRARFAVRTGEFTPYANVLVVCGVPF